MSIFSLKQTKPRMATLKVLFMVYFVIRIFDDSRLFTSAMDHSSAGGTYHGRTRRSQLVHSYALAARKHLASLKENKQHVRFRRQVAECPIPDDSTYSCDSSTKFRTIDGTCNNLANPKWGGSNRGVARFIGPDYSDDATGAARLAVSGNELPSARTISRFFTENPEIFRPKNARHTQLHVTFGQLVAHDILLTPESTINDGSGNLVSPTCGDDACDTTDPDNGECMPIMVDPDDQDFPNTECLLFVRSSPGFNDDCSNTARTQMNALTSWLDATHIYGPTADVENMMRDRSDENRGKLSITPHPRDSSLKGLLPQTDGLCTKDENMKCFMAGDDRANEQVGLSSFHTVWQRAHNTYEERLHALNPSWDGERLYQETRRLIGAIWQHIVYNEYLVTLLGMGTMTEYGLEPLKEGYFTGYIPSVNPDITSSFTSAAFRFGHSQIEDKLKLIDSNYQNVKEVHLSRVFKNPALVYDTSCPGGSPVDAILLGQVNQTSEQPDLKFSKQLTAHLFTTNPPFGPGRDLFAINIQRGRDHGVPSYLAFRRFCNLPVGDTFSNLPDISRKNRERLAQLYEHVEDIDLYVGGLAESQKYVGITGKTFSCIIAQQFKNLKVGDRFYYENQEAGFTLDQLSEIKKITLSKILCDNLDNIKTIQKYCQVHTMDKIMDIDSRTDRAHRCLMEKLGTSYNPRLSCEELNSINLEYWRED